LAKAVLTEHSAAVNYAKNNLIHCSDDDHDPSHSEQKRILLIIRPSFLVFSHDLFAALAHGDQACIISIDPDSSRRTADILKAMQASHFGITPRHLDSLDLDPAEFSRKGRGSIATIYVCGERADQRLVNTWAPWVRFYNSYGSTECLGVARRLLSDGDSPSLVGTPYPNVHVRIQTSPDTDPAPLEAGDCGEILVGGRGLARGYDPPDGDRFWRDGDGARWFRTGDMGRVLRVEKGLEVELVGRMDEFDPRRKSRDCTFFDCREVEALLRGREEVVDCGAGWDGDTVFALVVLRAAPSREAVLALERHCAAALPSTVWPIVSAVDAIPVTRSGKLDRRGLLELWRRTEAEGGSLWS
jgi:acyl-coenzyme A synthetase/AMP-(fatty) acid ligase